MMPRRCWLALLVHCRDVVTSAQTLKHAIGSGALDMVQLRATENDRDDDVITAGKLLSKMIHTYNQEIHNNSLLDTSTVQLTINHEALDVVEKAGATGWHWKERMLMKRGVEELQRQLSDAKNRNILVGCSVHSVEAAVLATTCSFDYIQVGTMFTTPSHPEKAEPALLEGPELLCRIRRATYGYSPPCPPLIAVGGINTADHIHQVLQAGADGVAVIRGILAADDSALAAHSYRMNLNQCHPMPQET